MTIGVSISYALVKVRSGRLQARLGRRRAAAGHLLGGLQLLQSEPEVFGVHSAGVGLRLEPRELSAEQTPLALSGRQLGVSAARLLLTGRPQLTAQAANTHRTDTVTDRTPTHTEQTLSQTANTHRTDTVTGRTAAAGCQHTPNRHCHRQNCRSRLSTHTEQTLSQTELLQQAANTHRTDTVMYRTAAAGC